MDLNADVGEIEGEAGLRLDLALLDVITSANIACGFHAGGPERMHALCAAAAERRIRIGAQVSYRDRDGFGRRVMDPPADQLKADLIQQISALARFGNVAYVKPHGALYNRAVWDEAQARAVIDAVSACGNGLPVVGLPGSKLLESARAAGLPAIEEGFADRAYTAGGRLVPRGEPGALITEPEHVVRQALALACAGRARTLCVHGDTPGAVALARRVHDALREAGFQIQAFA